MLKKLQFAFGPTKNPAAAAQVEGNKVTINPTGAFTDTSGSFFIEINARRDFVQLDNIEAAAFILAHELGHKAGKLLNDDDDPTAALSVLNNGKIQQACFSDVRPVPGPPG
jgi:hypothetical protein